MTRGAAPPRIVGRYALYEPLGKGGAASVFLSVERGDDPAVVAVKLLHESHARDSASVSRLLDEVRLSRLVQHHNVVRVRDFVSDGTEMLTVMDYIHGEPLSRLLVATGTRSKVSPPIAVSIVVDVLQGLHAAHEARDVDGTALHIVHRDVTPENVLVGDDGVARITDFGVAKAEGRLHKTRDGGVRGKLMYLAPEQVGGEVTSRTDVYAAGLVLWEMLVGMRPIEGETEAELVTKALDPKIARPSSRVSGLSQEIDDIVMRALAPDPEARFPSAFEMAQALVATGEIAPSELVAGWVLSLAGKTLDARSAAITSMLDAERAAELATAVGPSRAVAVVSAVEVERTIPTLASAGVASAEPVPSTQSMSASAARGPRSSVPATELMTVTRAGPAPQAPAPPSQAAYASRPVEAVGPVAVAPPVQPAATPASTRLLTGIAIGLGAAFVGAGIAIALRPGEPTAPPVMRDAGVILVPSAVPSVVPSASGSTTLLLDPSVEDAAAPVESAVPTPSETASGRTKPPHGGKGAPPTKCDPPWLIDSKGIRRYNPACIR